MKQQTAELILAFASSATPATPTYQSTLSSMKCSSSSALALAAIALMTAQLSSASTIKHTDMPRYLAEKSTLQQELEAWKQSEAGQFAQQHGFILKPTVGVMSDEQVQEDQVRRLFLTKLLIEDVQRENPDAWFSIDSPFTLMTDNEFAAYVSKSYRSNNTAFRGAASATTAVDGIPVLAQEVDWTASGCVTPIKNQGQCGSCWAFASVAVLESAYCLMGKTLTTFSEQQLTSCDAVSHGCEGGFPGDGLNYVQKEGKICSESEYPYTSGQSGASGQCQSECGGLAVMIQEVANVPQSESGLLAAVAKTPVAVGVAAGNRTWKQYKSGVVSTCVSSQLDHAVVVVGFGGSGSATPFFKIRNSWGTTWGEEGYIRLKGGVAGAGTCGVVGPKSVYPVL